MKYVYPNYYKKFKCIADKCKNSCCIGWEIDVDSDTYSYYKNLSGDFQKRLMKSINSDGSLHFILGDEEKCPFLNNDGLCEIVINLGEEALCQICSDHPRFRNYYSDRVEVGLGLCCEEAARLILSQKEKTRLIFTTDENQSATNKEKEFLYFRDNLFEILQNRKLPIKTRFMKILDFAEIEFPKKGPNIWAKLFMGLERLDDKWLGILEEVESLDIEESFDLSSFDICFEQLAVYLVYRHLSEAIYDERLKQRIKFVYLSLHFIQLIICAELKSKKSVNQERFIDICRMYSSEIEYSNENIESLLSVLD